jgi:stage III sporulation protein AF
MITYLKSWITGVVVTVIFMVLVDMILPSNNFKKYAKLVTGLIVIITILTPVFKLFKSNIDIGKYIDEYTKTMSQSQKKVDEGNEGQNINLQTIGVFKENLIKTIEKSILDKTGKKYSVANLEIEEDVTSYDFSAVKYLEIKKVSSSSEIKQVDKITIGQPKPMESESRDNGVLEILKNEFNIDSNAVKFVK